jgi:peptidoglycan-associated lipoprotein
MTTTSIRLLAVLLLVAGCSTTDESADIQSDAASAEVGQKAAASGIASTDLPGQPVPGTQEDLEVTVGDRVYFDYDSTVLDEEATAILDRQAAWLKQYPDVRVTIEGHTDERGTREYNLALGDRRAHAVRNYLVALEVPDDRLLTISYGEERPAEPGHDETAWALNRRAVSVISTVN